MHANHLKNGDTLFMVLKGEIVNSIPENTRKFYKTFVLTSNDFEHNYFSPQQIIDMFPYLPSLMHTLQRTFSRKFNINVLPLWLGKVNENWCVEILFDNTYKRF